MYTELIAKLKRTIRVTKMERQERVEKTFENLMMGRLALSAFRAEWEACLKELEDAGVDSYSPDTLKRRYLGKISPELRSAVMRQVFVLDENGPPRKP